MSDSHPMYEVVFMDEASGKSVINVPLPPEDAPEKDKDSFAATYFEKVMKKYKVNSCNILRRNLC